MVRPVRCFVTPGLWPIQDCSFDDDEDDDDDDEDDDDDDDDDDAVCDTSLSQILSCVNGISFQADLSVTSASIVCLQQ